MITNIISLLHATAPYQAAVLQLMVNEANFTAKQLELNETVPATPAEYHVAEPALGIGGEVSSSNYTFSFDHGKLRAVHIKPFLEKIRASDAPLVDLDTVPSLLDTNSAYQLTTQRLAAISIDLAELQERFQPDSFRVGNEPPPDAISIAIPNVRIRPQARKHLAMFVVGWRSPESMAGRSKNMRWHFDPCDPVRVQFLGSTKELLFLDIGDRSLLKRPAMELTNALELLGPIPPPRDFVEELLGGKEAYLTVQNPDEVEIAVLTQLEYDNTHDSTWSGPLFKPQRDRLGPVKLNPELAKAFSDTLLNFNSYNWGTRMNYTSDFLSRLRFKRGKETMEFLLSYQCDIVEIKNGQGGNTANLDGAKNDLLKLIQKVFPQDQIVTGLKPKK